MVDNIVAFPQKHEDDELETVSCGVCNSRAYRFIKSTEKETWSVECHNCGNPTDVEVLWEHGTH